MKILNFTILYFLILGIQCCSDDITDSPNALDCFNSAITSKEIGEGENADDYQCCYMKYHESSNSVCFLIEKSRKDTYLNEYKQVSGIIPYAFGCSLEELPDESKSSSCFIQNPIKKEYCFSRSLSSSEKVSNGGYTPNKCCYVEYTSIAKYCQPLDESKLDDYLKALKQSATAAGQEANEIKVTCFDDSSSDSYEKIMRISSLLFLLISLILF